MSENMKAAKCYQHGTKAMNSQNWDLAVEMFSTCVKLVPHHLAYRQFLRNSTKKKYDENGTGAGTFGKTKLISIRKRIKKAKAAEEWEEVSKAAEEGLLLNPWDAALNMDLADASRELDRGEIARFAYLEACKAAPKEKEYWVKAAEFLEERGEYTDAYKLWDQIRVIDPKDIEVSRKLSALSAREATRSGGYDDAEDSRSVSVNKGATQGQRAVAATSDETETALTHAIRREPEQVENYLKLAAHLKKTRKFEKSYETLKKAVEVSGGDPGVREQLEDAELLLMKHNVDLAKEKANQSEDPAMRKQVAELSNELRARQIEVLSAREQRHPQDLRVKMELAKLVMQLQEWSKAIPLLQKASQDPRNKTKALVLLGKCFMYDNKLPLAKGQFERAVPDLNFDNDPETFKEAHYLLARVAEETGDQDTAETHYGEVLVVDYDYKDARARLEGLQAGSS